MKYKSCKQILTEDIGFALIMLGGMSLSMAIILGLILVGI